jgi:integrase
LPQKARQDQPVQISYYDRIERGLSLVLTIGTSGARTFSAQIYVRGRPKLRKVGSYPGLTVKDARSKAREYWSDPAKFDAQAQMGSFRDVAESWLARHVRAKGLRSEHEIERQLQKYVYPVLGSHKFIEVRRREITDLLDDIEDRNGAAQADAVLATIRSIANWYQSRTEAYISPVVRGMKRNGATSRNRILTDDEIRAVFKCAEGVFGRIVRFALLTAQRKAKLATLKWTDIDDGLWMLPKAQREKGNPGILRLPSLALDVIEECPRTEGNPYVFVGRGNAAFNSWSEKKRELDAKLKQSLPEMPRWTIHDLRRTARSLMSRAGVLPHVAEQVLGHAQPGIVGIYDRHRYDVEKADALARLATLLGNILEPERAVVMLSRESSRPLRAQ